MPQTCTVCRHPERAVVEAALLRGEPLRDIAGQFSGLTKSAVARHKADHLPAAMAKAHGAAEVADADELIRQAGLLRSKAISLLMKAEQSGDLRTALAGVREARGCIELLARLLGELKEGPTLNVVVSPAWVELRAVVVAALTEFPDARAVVAERLAALEADAR